MDPFPAGTLSSPQLSAEWPQEKPGFGREGSGHLLGTLICIGKGLAQPSEEAGHPPDRQHPQKTQAAWQQLFLANPLASWPV